MAEVVTVREALAPAALAELRDALFREGKPQRVPRTPLYALSATFRRDGFEELGRRSPALARFVALANDRRGSRRLWTLRERGLEWLARLQPNAFVARLLLVPPDAAVAPHVDSTLRRYTSADRPPRLVSVLCLDDVAAPICGDGGHLRLHRDGVIVADIAPVPGMLVHFRGDLLAEVTRFTAATSPATDGRLRASLVCEQYCLADGVLGRLPRFTFSAPARFASVLRRGRSMGSRHFLL